MRIEFQPFIKRGDNAFDLLYIVTNTAATLSALLLSFRSEEDLLKHKRFDFGSEPSRGRL